MNQSESEAQKEERITLTIVKLRFGKGKGLLQPILNYAKKKALWCIDCEGEI